MEELNDLEKNFMEVIHFVIEEYDNIYPSGGSGHMSELIKFEISPREYLMFCTEVFSKEQLSISDEISIISNLKRALDSQIAIFFRFLNIDTYIGKKHFGFDKRFDFIHEIGLFPKSSVLRLSNIRNKIEHEFSKPKLNEILIFYDLAFAFIIVIEKTIALMQSMCGFEMALGDWSVKNGQHGGFYIDYNFENSSIDIEINKNGIESKYIFSINRSYKIFTKTLALFLLIQQDESGGNSEYTLSEIKKLHLTTAST